jgi:hypothetical protein
MWFINTTQHIEIEKFEDIKGVILTVKSRKDRQYNGQKKNAKNKRKFVCHKKKGNMTITRYSVSYNCFHILIE